MGVMKSLVGLMAFAALAACEQKAVNTTIDPPAPTPAPSNTEEVARDISSEGGDVTVRDAPRGSADRAQLMDALRPRVVRDYGGSVEFVVREIRIAAGYAYVSAKPQRPGGGPLTDCIQGIMECKGDLHALFQGRTGQWTLIDYDDYDTGGLIDYCATQAKAVLDCEGYDPELNPLESDA